MSRLLKLMGLQAEPDPNAWMAVATDLAVDDTATGACADARRIIDALAQAGVVAQQRSYVLADRGRTSNFSWGSFAGGLRAVDRVRIAVVVHAGDLEQAKGLVAAFGPLRTASARQRTPRSAGLPPTDVTKESVPDN